MDTERRERERERERLIGLGSVKTVRRSFFQRVRESETVTVRVSSEMRERRGQV